MEPGTSQRVRSQVRHRFRSVRTIQRTGPFFFFFFFAFNTDSGPRAARAYGPWRACWPAGRTLLFFFCFLWLIFIEFLQEIDGEALLYLSQNDLVDILGVKLGPAIKIRNALLLIKEKECPLAGAMQWWNSLFRIDEYWKHVSYYFFLFVLFFFFWISVFLYSMKNVVCCPIVSILK